jgi:hypothetical protein
MTRDEWKKLVDAARDENDYIPTRTILDWIEQSAGQSRRDADVQIENLQREIRLARASMTEVAGMKLQIEELQNHLRREKIAYECLARSYEEIKDTPLQLKESADAYKEISDRIYKLGITCDRVPGLKNGFCPDIGEPRDNLTRIKIALERFTSQKVRDTCENFRRDGDEVLASRFCSTFKANSQAHAPTCQFFAKKRVDKPECDCMIPALEGAGQHSPTCAIFKKDKS